VKGHSERKSGRLQDGHVFDTFVDGEEFTIIMKLDLSSLARQM